MTDKTEITLTLKQKELDAIIAALDFAWHMDSTPVVERVELYDVLRKRLKNRKEIA